MAPTEQRLPIKTVARRTGLTSHVIRIWERRYGAVTPQRTATNRRLYSLADVERLQLLRRAINSGRNIGQIANLSTDKLQEILAADSPSNQIYFDSFSDQQLSTTQVLLQDCITAVTRFDAELLEQLLTRATVTLSQPILIERILMPLMYNIGELWREGSLRVAHEHMASAIVRTFLGNIKNANETSENAPAMIFTTPIGHQHELGALMAATTASAEGYRAIYLGPSLPAEEIAMVAHERQARAVVLSIIYPADDPRTLEELKRLRRFLPAQTLLIAGGRAAESYRAVFNLKDFLLLTELSTFRLKLSELSSDQEEIDLE